MPRWNEPTERLVWRITAHLRKRRNELFLHSLSPGPHHTILDLGSEDGSQLASFYPYPQNVTIADTNEAPLRHGVTRFGLAGYILIDPDGQLPLPDHSFDFVYCNSVIEHVTTTVNSDQRTFVDVAVEHQRRFANEIRRVGLGYFVQTPNLHFPIESHSLLPFVGYLSAHRNAQLARMLKRYWIKQWSGGTHLLTLKDMASYFPDAEMVPERFCGLVKSWMAVRRHPDQHGTTQTI